MQWQTQPLTRLALAVGGALLVLGTDWPAALLAEGVSVGLLILTVRLGRNWLRQLRLLLPMLTLLGLIGWWTLDPLTIGLALARLVILTSIFLILFQTTAPEDLGEALTQVGLPRHWGFILGSAFHFVPVLERAIADVRDAQRSRGIRLEGDLASLPNYPALLIPIVIHAFKLADDLAEALESRGFSRAGRTVLAVQRLGWRDYGGLVLAVGLAALAIWV